MLWYLAWRIIDGINETISLNFLISGHTKNRCDGSFGLVKRKLRQRNAIVPSDMKKVIDDSSTNNSAVCGSDVLWYNWKLLLDSYFTIPSGFQITRYHVFQFCSTRPGYVRARSLSSSESFYDFSLLRKDVTVRQVRNVRTFMNDPGMHVDVADLSSVKSTHEGNRRAYLVKNVLDRYYEGQDAIRSSFFENGSSFRNAP